MLPRGVAGRGPALEAGAHELVRPNSVDRLINIYRSKVGPTGARISKRHGQLAGELPSSSRSHELRRSGTEIGSRRGKPCRLCRIKSRSPRGTEPAAVSSVANGGLPAVSLTAVVPQFVCGPAHGHTRHHASRPAKDPDQAKAQFHPLYTNKSRRARCRPARRPASQVEDDEPVIPLRGRHVPLIAQSPARA